MQDQNVSLILRRHLDALRNTTEYGLLLEVVSRMCYSSQPEKGLAAAADTVLRSIASDLSGCCPDGRIVIFHMFISHGQG